MDTPETLRTYADLLRNVPDNRLSEPLASELLQRGIVNALEDLAAETSQEDAVDWRANADQFLSPVGLLYQTAASHPNETIRKQAYRGLVRLAEAGGTQAVDAIYTLATEMDLLAAQQMILTHGWQPSRPTLGALFDWFYRLASAIAYPQDDLARITQAYFEEASPALQRRLLVTAPIIGLENWARITSALQESQAQGETSRALQNLVSYYAVFSSEERRMLLGWLERLALAGSHAARETICLLFLQHEDPTARQVAVAHAYAPEDPEQRALFFFLVEAWDDYETLDFNRNLITSAYESADRRLRRRMLEHSRYTGYLDWLRRLQSASEVRWVGDLSDADWELAIDHLREGDRLDDLWRLSQVAPPVWSASVLELLARRDWKPELETDQPDFSHLVALARDSLANPLLLQPKKSLHFPSDNLNCLAIDPTGCLLAGGSSDQRVYLWELPQGDLRIPPLIGPTPIIRSLAFSLDGELIASASNDQRIRIFRLSSGQVIKTLDGHQAMIRSLALHPDGRALYSASFDGSIRIWRFPFGPEQKTIHPGSGEIFSMAIAGDGRHLLSAGASRQVQVWALPEGSLIRELTGHQRPVTHLAASPNGDLVASAGRDGLICVWNFTSGSLVRTIDNRDGQLTGLTLHPNEQALIGGFSNGQIVVWSLSTGKVIDQPAQHENMITGLVLSPTGDVLYTCDATGRLLVWDLRTFLTNRLFGEIAQPGAIDALQKRLQQPGLSTAEKTWLSFATALARWRQRYDIELGEVTTITVGEYDIEIS